MRKYILSIVFLGSFNFCQAGDIDIIDLSQQILLKAKTDQPTDHLKQSLAGLSINQLSIALYNDNTKKTFWINIYNAFTQILLTSDAAAYKRRNAFFGKKQIIIAGTKLSFDDIEHGILRRSKNKWSLGYFNSLFPDQFEKRNRVDTVDYRIHFALNCGAKSCPPIAFYSPEKIDQQLNTATKVYLLGESSWDDVTKKIYLPKMMSWFRADFGGKKGMKALIDQYALAPSTNKITIRYKEYDWSLFLAQYQSY